MADKTPKGTIADRKRFIAAAREAGCDESEEAFKGKLRKLVTAKPTTNAEVGKRKRKRKV